MATPGNTKDIGFPALNWEEEALSTRPLPLHELPRQVGIDAALRVVEKHHERIAKSIRIFWGSRDCVEYIEKLVMSGGDGFGKARVGFKPEVVSALMSLMTLHRVDPESAGPRPNGA